MANINNLRIGDVTPDTLMLDKPYQSDSTAAIDYSSVEIWDAYVGSTQVYHKDKTIENCWRKYKYITDKTSTDGTTKVKSLCADSSFGDNIIVPIPTDLDSFFDVGDGKWPSFNIKAANSELWDEIKSRLSSIGINLFNSDYEQIKGMFEGSNIGGVLNIKVLNTGNIAADRMFQNCNVSEVNFTYVSEEDEICITSINSLFINTPNLKTITSTKDFRARDMSGAFSFSGIETIPGIINYWARGYNSVNGYICYCSITQYFCDMNSSVTTINRYRGATNREDPNNTIKLSTGLNMFNQCTKLTTIDPILDMEYVRPSNSSYMFNQCNALVDVRIKNLNHGNWRFDSGGDAHGGTLPNLNQESVEYLFANLKDLTTRNPDLVYSGGSPSDTDFNGDTCAANPDVSAANLYCPSNWESYITSEMISAANAKGWTIYVGGSVKSAQ